MLKESQMIPGLYFDSRPMEMIRFVYTAIITYSGIKKNYYSADSEGNVFSLDNRLIHPTKINSGYYTYHLLSDNQDQKYKAVLAHRLILYTFNPIDNFEQFTVNHINMNPSDNRLCNLEWVSQLENNRLKYMVHPNDGTNNYKALFSHQQLYKILECLEAKLPYKDILISIGIEPTENNCNSIGNIKRGITYVSEINEIISNRFND